MSSAQIVAHEPIRRVDADRAVGEHPVPAMPPAWLGDRRVSVVIPALNEAACLPHVMPRLPAWLHEVLLVDGQSTDDTVEVARRLYPAVRIVSQQGRGKGAALRTGLLCASGDIIVTLDADGSTDPAEIPAFVGALLGGADFAKGSRFLQGAGSTDMAGLRRFGNWGFAVFANVLFQTRFSDLTYGYNAVWAHHRWALALEIDGWPHEIITNIRVATSGLKVVEVASFEHARVAGSAKLQLVPAAVAILTAILAERLRGRPRRMPEVYVPVPATASVRDVERVA
jgi:glycosyltransferase involved in cell wall biosynthesis